MSAMMVCRPCSPNSSMPDIGGIENRERRLEQVFQLDLALGHAAIFQQREVLGLLGRDVLRDQPGMEILGDFLVLAS